MAATRSWPCGELDVHNNGVRRSAGLASVLLATSLVMTQAPALAAGRAVTHVKATAAPATVLVKGAIAVSGSTSPKAAVSLAVQSLVGKTWTTIGHAKSSKAGAYVLSVHAPKTAGVLTLRVSRAATAGSTSSVSATLHVRVVKTAFAVTTTHSASPVTLPAQLVVTGKVSAKAKGSVSLDRLVGTAWVSLGKATLTKASTYTLRKTLAAGSYELRVSKALTTTVAGGVGKSFDEVVKAAIVTAPPTTAPPTIVLPVVSTTSLAGVIVGSAYATTLLADVRHGAVLLVRGQRLAADRADAALERRRVRQRDLGRHVQLHRPGDRRAGTLGHRQRHRRRARGRRAVLGLRLRRRVRQQHRHGEPRARHRVPARQRQGGHPGGDDFTLALLTDGTVYAWGQNGDGQLGLGDTAERDTPVLITSLSHVTAISAGEDASYAVTASGALYAWGDNNSGQQDNGSANATLVETPTQTPLTNVVSVSAGHDFALALLGNGNVMGWGNGTNGVIGDGNETTQVTTAVQSRVSVGDRVDVVAISAGAAASYALLSDGTVQAWGLQERGQLGHAPTTTYQPLPTAIAGLTGVTALSLQRLRVLPGTEERPHRRSLGLRYGRRDGPRPHQPRRPHARPRTGPDRHHRGDDGAPRRGTPCTPAAPCRPGASTAPTRPRTVTPHTPTSPPRPRSPA